TGFTGGGAAVPAEVILSAAEPGGSDGEICSGVVCPEETKAARRRIKHVERIIACPRAGTIHSGDAMLRSAVTNGYRGVFGAPVSLARRTLALSSFFWTFAISDGSDSEGDAFFHSWIDRSQWLMAFFKLPCL